MTSLKKVLLIFLLGFICLYISLPKEVPLKFRMSKYMLDTKLIRRDLVVNKGKLAIDKKFDLILGLDLAGGSRLTFEADLKNISDDKKKGALESLRNVMEKRVNLFGISEPNVLISEFEGKSRVVVELPGVKDTSKAIEVVGKTASLVFATLVGEGEEAGLVPSDLTGADLSKAEVAFDQQTGKPSVSIEFSAEGGEKFAKLTKENVGKVLPILLDGMPVSAPVVQEEIIGGKAQITGEFSLEEAKNLSIQLNAGALPIPVNLVEERTVGATLGAESVKKSVNAGLVGLLMVFLFMILVYGRFGIIADLGLLFFGVITLALYKLIPVVLTLPGIAGFLLSVGMAVDSNILIFERFKEERKRRSLTNALEVSFGRAWDSIRDANIATLVTAFILANPLDFNFLHTSGPVRGFAITLALGIVVSLFTGLVVSRNLLRVFIKSKKA